MLLLKCTIHTRQKHNHFTQLSFQKDYRDSKGKVNVKKQSIQNVGQSRGQSDVGPGAKKQALEAGKDKDKESALETTKGTKSGQPILDLDLQK